MFSYTYLIKFLPTGQVYYGSRSKNIKLGLTPEQDLMVRYFTSCKPLKKLIKQHGVSAFSWEVRRRFDTSLQAAQWEQKVLRRMKVVHSKQWFNQNAAGFIVPTSAGLKKISEFHSGKLWYSKEGEISIRVKPEEAVDWESKGWWRGRGNFPKRIAPRTKEHCDALSKSLTGKYTGENAAFFGHHHSQENKLAHSKRMKGIAPPNKGLSMSKAQKDKISVTKKSRIFTEEDREQKRKSQRLAVASRLKKKQEIQNQKPSN